MRDGEAHRGSWFPRWFWPSFAAPAAIWLLLFFVLPFYVVLSVAFGTLDPIFLTATPVYDPTAWDATALRGVVSNLFTAGSIEQQTLLRTFVYVSIATVACLLIGYPVAYFIARHARRTKAFFLIAFIAPFWISYMMRMFAWVNLLQPDGYVNRILQALGILQEPRSWLNGDPSTVILGLIYGYVPFMILPLFGTLDRIERSTVEAARDLGAGQLHTFTRVTLPLSRQGILAGCIIVALPMFGDYFTQTLLASTRQTAMFGNLIVASVESSLVNAGASLVIVLLLLLIAPMLYYLHSTNVARELASR
ncbi:MAG TPA: ABC transporter permease [Actinomycetota bacterium]|nr:ABC transporter permease [Actinomycetota bacterium]